MRWPCRLFLYLFDCAFSSCKQGHNNSLLSARSLVLHYSYIAFLFHTLMSVLTQAKFMLNDSRSLSLCVFFSPSLKWEWGKKIVKKTPVIRLLSPFFLLPSSARLQFPKTSISGLLILVCLMQKKRSRGATIVKMSHQYCPVMHWLIIIFEIKERNPPSLSSLLLLEINLLFLFSLPCPQDICPQASTHILGASWLLQGTCWVLCISVLLLLLLDIHMGLIKGQQEGTHCGILYTGMNPSFVVSLFLLAYMMQLNDLTCSCLTVTL